MRFAAAILAGGASTRAGFDKTLADLGGKPVWRWSYEAYLPLVDEILVVASAANRAHIDAGVVILGGATRQESARAALDAVGCDALLFHDAARPFVSAKVISDVMDAVRRSRAAAAAIPVHDTIKSISDEGVVTLDRTKLVAMQTPQGARVDLLRQAHRLATSTATDDMALLEAIGVQPEMVAGDEENFKITTEQDYRRAMSMAGARVEFRTGFGYDVHPFSTEAGRLLMLGGIAFPGHAALDGHSDADVLLHAATDAILGAARLGDIGRHFPNTDMRWKGEPSLTFQRFASQGAAGLGWSLTNLDVTVVAESPKITPRVGEMVACMAEALGVTPDRVNIKATTNEGMGFVGRREGIAATAVCTLRRI